MNDDVMRDWFEKVTCPNLTGKPLERHAVNGHYLDSTVDDHWNTFQEGWESAIDDLKRKTNPAYTDIFSDGGFDPRREP